MKFTQHEAVEAFQKSDKEAFLAARHIRAKLNFEEQSFVLDKLVEDTPKVTKFLTGVCLANNWGEVWNPPAVASMSSSQRALDWFMLTAKRYAKHLDSHVKLRNQLNRATLHGEWDAAKSILEKHHREFGPTLWGMNWTILLIEESRGAQYKADYIKQFEKDEFGKAIPVFATFFGLSSDQTLTVVTKDKIVGTTPLALLQQNLCNIFLKNENSDDSLNYLQRFGRRFRIFPLTQPLRSLHASHSSHFQNENWYRRGS